MKSIKRAYYYLFYQLYRWYENSQMRWGSDWKAGISIIALEIWFFLSIGIYFSVITKKTTELTLTHPIVLFPFSFILILNYFMFIHSDKWKTYVWEFDQLPKRKNKVGGWIVFGTVVLIITNYIFSFYLLYQN